MIENETDPIQDNTIVKTEVRSSITSARDKLTEVITKVRRGVQDQWVDVVTM